LSGAWTQSYRVLDGGGATRGEQRMLSRESVRITRVGIEVPAELLEETCCFHPDIGADDLSVELARGGKGAEHGQLVVGRLYVDSVEGEHVKVKIAAQTVAKSLHHGHAAGKSVAHATQAELALGGVAQPRKDLAEKDAEDLRAELGIVGQEISQWGREGEHPHPYRHTGKNASDEKGCGVVHTPSGARGAKAAPLARPGYQTLVATSSTARQRGATLCDPAAEKSFELASYKPRKVVASLLELDQDRCKILVENPEEYRVGGHSWSVLRG